MANSRLSISKQQKFAKHAKNFSAYTAKGQYKSAIKQANLALKIIPNHMQVVSDLAFCLLRDQQYQEAYLTYKHIFHSGESAHQQASNTWLDGLAEVCGWLDKKEELQRFGCLSLRKADTKVCSVEQLNSNGLDNAQIAANLQRPRAKFNTQTTHRNIISFSLFGNMAKYCEGAVINAQVATQIFPNWQCRFYIAQDVPDHVITRLQLLGVQLVFMDTQVSPIHPLLWRFLVLDDEGVDFYMIRDADSLLSEKEQAAVEQWLESEYWFHHMRDYFTHTELLLAGMWAGARGSLIKITPHITRFCQTYESTERFIDQYFLREYLWPQVKGSILCHDEIFNFHSAQPYPKHAPLRWRNCQFHIGSNCSYQHMVMEAIDSTSISQSWQILDQDNNEICRYSSEIEDNKITLCLPFVYIQKIQSGDWRAALLTE
jgi:hypothetical protein